MKNPLRALWIGRCTIQEYKEITDPDTWQTSHELVSVVVGEPCRLSRRASSTTDVVNGAPIATHQIVLFIKPDIVINEGSVIEITQHDVTTKYKRSSKPFVYTNHQEVELELYEDKA